MRNRSAQERAEADLNAARGIEKRLERAGGRRPTRRRDACASRKAFSPRSTISSPRAPQASNKTGPLRRRGEPLERPDRSKERDPARPPRRARQGPIR